MKKWRRRGGIGSATGVCPWPTVIELFESGAAGSIDFTWEMLESEAGLDSWEVQLDLCSGDFSSPVDAQSVAPSLRGFSFGPIDPGSYKARVRPLPELGSPTCPWEISDCAEVS